MFKRFICSPFLFFLFVSSFLFGQVPVQKVVTLAGSNIVKDSVGVNAYFLAPWCIVGHDSIVYFSDTAAFAIKRMSIKTKKVTTLLSNQKWVTGLALTPTKDSLYFVCQANILKVYKFSNQTVSTLDTLAESPIDALICTKNGSLIFSGGSSHMVRMRSPQGVYTNLAGKYGVSGFVDGRDTVARFFNIGGFALSRTEDTLYISDRFNSKIRRLNRITKIVSTLNFASPAGLFGPRYICLNQKKDTLIVANSSNHTILRYAIRTNSGSLWCGATGNPNFADGTPAQSRFYYPIGVVLCDSGYLVCDWVNQRIRLLRKNGQVRTFAGMGKILNGKGTQSRYYRPHDIVKHPKKDTVYISDQLNHVVRLIDLRTNESKTLAGDGIAGNLYGIGGAARFTRPMSLAISATGDSLFVAEPFSNRIKLVLTKTREVKWLAGSDTAGYVDKPNGKFARFNRPSDIALKGNLLYVADAFNHKIRTINIVTTEVKTYAGSTAGFKDSTLLLSRFNRPNTLEWVENKLFVGEDVGLRIRNINPETGLVKVWAGSGVLDNLDGFGTGARFRGIFKISYNPVGRLLYVGGYGNEGYYRTVGVDEPWVSTIASVYGYVDGKLGDAKFAGPQGLCMDSARKQLLIADDMNNRIRTIKYFPNTNPTAKLDTVISFLEDAGLVTINGFATNFSVGNSPGDTLQNFSFSFAQPQDPRIMGGSLNENGNLQIQAAPDSNGIFPFYFRMKDNGGTAWGGVDSNLLATKVKITPVNDPPIFSILGNDTALHELPRIKTGFITSLKPGPYDERNQATQFSIIVDKPEKFLVQPFIEGTTLRFTPKPDSLGPVQAQIKCSDDGGIANGGLDISEAQNFIIFIWDPLMIKEIKENRLAIYPNPSLGNIHLVNLPAGTNGLRFTNNLGQLVWEQNLAEGQSQITLPEHIKGWLFVHTMGGRELKTGKVVIH